MNKDKSPLVSIIVPVHNAEYTIKRCVNSLVNQTYSNIEIILVENGSQDNSWEICKMFYDKRIVLQRIPSDGVSVSRNKGLEVSKGEYITFCDSDDFYSSDHIEQNLKTALAKKSDLVISGYFIQRNNKFVPYVMESSHVIANEEELLVNIITTDYIMGVCWNKLIKRDAIQGIRFPEEMDVLEDTYFLLKVLKNVRSIFYLNKPLYYYCYNPKSVVRNKELLISNNNFKYITSYKKILNDFTLNKRINKLMKARIFEFAIEAKYLIQKEKIGSKSALLNIKNELSTNRVAFYSCKDLTFTRKLKDFFKLHMSVLRDIKHFNSN